MIVPDRAQPETPDATGVEVIPDGEAGTQGEPRRVRQLIAPLALVVGLAVTVVGTILIPSAANEDMAESTGPRATSAQPVSRSTTRQAPDPVASASPTVSPPSSARVVSSVQTPPLSEVVGSRYATENLNVREQPSVSSDKIGSIAQGDEVRVTDLRRDGWRQISLDGRPGWVRSDYLSLAKPKNETRAVASPGPTGGTPSNRD